MHFGPHGSAKNGSIFVCPLLPWCANVSVFPCYRGKGSVLKMDSFVVVFGLSCFDFSLYFYLKVKATWYVNILWVRSVSPVCMFGK